MRVARKSIQALTLTLVVLSGGLTFSGAEAFAGFHIERSFGSFGSGSGQFSTPAGVAVEQSTGDVFVADAGNKRVEKFSPEGTKVLAEINGSETPQKELPEAYGVAIDNSTEVSDKSKGDIYVSSARASAVDKFRPKGASGNEPNEYVYECQLTGPGGGCYPDPKAEGKVSSKPFSESIGVAVDSKGNLYVGATNVIYEFNSSGGDVSPPLESSELIEPFSVAVDSEGNVYATKLGSYTVKFNAAHGFEGLLDSKHSYVVAADPSSSDVYVVDSEGGFRVAEYEAGGKLLGKATLIEEFGATDIGASGSFGIAYSSFNGDVYVGDVATDEIKVFTTVTVKPPLPTKCEAAGVTASSAALKATVNPQGEEDHWYFEWGETTAYGQLTSEQAASGSGFSPVEADLTQLAPHTTYHCQLLAYPKHKTTELAEGGDGEFTTTAIPPLVVGEPASFVTTKAATLLAKVNPEHSATRFHFEYGASEGYGRETPEESAGSGLTTGFVSRRLEGLTPGATYHFRVVAANEQHMTERGPDEAFTTGTENPPVALTGAASNVTQSGATVLGTINPEGWTTAYVFELGTTDAYGTQISGPVGSGTEPQAVSVALQGLAPGTTYHYRLTAVNRNGTSYSADETFTTPGYSYTYLLTVPPTLALIPTPAFPPVKSTATVTKKLTNAQKLAAALKACKKDVRHAKRKKCEKAARAKYGPVHKKAVHKK